MSIYYDLTITVDKQIGTNLKPNLLWGNLSLDISYRQQLNCGLIISNDMDMED